MAQVHAGFAIVGCFTQDLVNDLIEAAVTERLPPVTFALPSPIAVDGRQVTLAGEFAVLPPTVTLADRPDGLVAVRARFAADLRLSGITPFPVDVAVELGCSVLVGMSVAVVNDRFQVGLDLSQASFTQLDVTITDGPPLVRGYGAALTSGPVIATLTAILRSLPPGLTRITPTGFPATLVIAPKQMPCGASLFDPPETFHASLSVLRVVPRPLDGVMAVGIDIAGISLGNPAQLASLFGMQRSVWMLTTNPDGPSSFAPRSIKASGNLGFSVNPDALVAILQGPMSQATDHAFVNCNVALQGLSVDFGTFSPPLQPGLRIDGATLRVGARYYTSPGRRPDGRLAPDGPSVHVDVSFPLAVHFQSWDGPGNFTLDRVPGWFVKVYEPDIEIPWWVTAGLVLIGVFVRVLSIPVFLVLVDFLPTELGKAESASGRSVQSGISGGLSQLDLAADRISLTLPGLPNTPASRTLNLFSITGEGFDVFSTLYVGARPDTRPDRNLVVTVGGSAVRDGEAVSLQPEFLQPLACVVRARDGLFAALDQTVRVSWEVRRQDTGAILIQQDMPYASLRLAPLNGGGGPTPRRIVIDRSAPGMAEIAEFQVYVRVYRPLFGRTKEFGTCRFRMPVIDRFDRTHPYVRWDGWAAGVPKRSAIHRTAVPGRCRMLNRAAQRAKFEYLDKLPFEASEIVAKRDGLCDYCFFGGPDKSVPLI